MITETAPVFQETFMKEKIEAVVFDMDGVIFDSEKVYRMMERRAFEKYGLPLDMVDPFCERIAGGTKVTNRRHFEEMFGTDIDYLEFRECVNSGVDVYGRDPGFDVKPGIRELLRYLKDSGIRVGLATSTASDRAEYHLKRHGLYDFFDEIVYGNMVTRGKPFPDIFLKACEKLGTAPEHTMGIEDSINGILACHAAGLYTVMVIDLIQPNDAVKEAADAILNRADEVIRLLEA